jgi:dephospho-CoA kinase
MKIVGITGSIGCGKTYLANIIKKLGFSVYNPDFWVRDLYQKKDFLQVIAREFPQTFENGVFNKRKLRTLVFDDNKQLKKLESLIHPFLGKKLKKIINKNARHEDVLFLDVALLLEFGWDKYCDYIIVADVDDDIQKQRVMKRDHISEADFNKIVAVQMDKNLKRAFADVVIDTNSKENHLKVLLIKFIEEIL